MEKQVEVRQALREWFEALRGDSEGVHGTKLVDAVITLGLNHDYKQVNETKLEDLYFFQTKDTGRKQSNEMASTYYVLRGKSRPHINHQILQ